MKSNCIKHLRSSPYHPSSNGLAECLVQTFKQTMKRGAHQGLTVQQRLADFLLRYRITPHSTTHRAPAELLMGRKLRTRLDLLYIQTAAPRYAWNKPCKSNVQTSITMGMCFCLINKFLHRTTDRDHAGWPG